MTTIREVAEKAGVSFTTVSHVINNTRFVSEETRERVLAAMEELHYRQNALARSLRSGKTHTLGLILPDSSNPFFADIGRSVEAAAFELGYSVILCNTESDLHREQLYVDVLSKKQVDGVIFVATGDQANSAELLVSLNLPVVLVDREILGIGLDSVLADNCQGGMLATNHLIQFGHRRIACITGPSYLTPSAERITGFSQAMEAAQIKVEDSYLLRGDFHSESGYTCTRQLLSLPEPPTAIFSCNDLMAIGVLRAAAEAGLRLPQDLSIVGFDDIELASYTSPPLTTISQPIGEIGRIATHLLVDRMEDKTLSPRREILPPKLIVRGSTGPAPEKEE